MFRRLLVVSASLALLASVSPQIASAQVPSTAEPSRASNQFTPQQAPAMSDFKGKISAQGAAAAAPAGADKVTLTLKEISIEGASVYSEAQLQSVYGDKLNTKITLAEVYNIAAQLTAKYRNDGYIPVSYTHLTLPTKA